MDNSDRLAASAEDIGKLLDRLTAHAAMRLNSLQWRPTGRDGVVPRGESAETIAQSAFLKLLNGAKWDAEKALSTVLMGIVDSQIANLVRSWENKRFQNLKTTSIDEEPEINQITDEGLNPIELTERAEDDDIALKILDALEVDSSEYRVASAIFDGNLKRSDIMSAAALSASEYEATKKRLRTFLKKFWQNQAANQHKESATRP